MAAANIGGAANVWRSCGSGLSVAAAAPDPLKRMLPTLAAPWLPAGQPAAIVLVGLAAILGHTFPPFLNFRGGSAVATSRRRAAGAVPAASCCWAAALGRWRF
ncbi:MAG: glycerol-3-phosphate acyltransferase [Kouleothrix sp.]